MKRLLLTALTAAFVVAPASTAAQIYYPGIPDAQEYLNFLSGSGVSEYGVQVGPYLGEFSSDPTSPDFSIYCVDYAHYAKDTWVNVTALDPGADLSNTRFGNYNTYLKTAYLSSLFDTAPKSDWGEIHVAIWQATGTYGGSGNSGTYGNIASAPNAFSGAGWYILTPTNKADGSSGQEFLMRTRVSVPEPSTLLLLGTGFVFFFIARRRRFEILEENA
jgi:hypothetical protein